MLKPSAQPPHTQNFKKRPLSQLMTLTLSLAGYGLISSRAYAGPVGNPLTCDVTTNITLTEKTDNLAPCIIENTGSIFINNTTLSNFDALSNYGDLHNDSYLGSNSTLKNYAGATLTNAFLLANLSDGLGSNSSIVNSGTLTNLGGFFNGSYNEGTATLYNAAGATLINDVLLVNYSQDTASTSTLTNSGTLTNLGGFFNGSYNGGASLLNNAAGATLSNSGLIINESYASTSTLTNSGTLINSGTPIYDSNDDLVSEGGLINYSYGYDSVSQLTNNAGATLTNSGLLVNDSTYYGASTLTNSGTLTNTGELYNDSYAGGTSTLTNSVGATLTNEDHLHNYSYDTGSTSTLTNSGTLTNTGELYNESYAGGNATLYNAAGATLSNSGLLVNDSTYYGASTLTNSGTLTNTGELYNESYAGGASLLNNTDGATLTNEDHLHNDSNGAGSTSTLTNSGTLLNKGKLYNEGYNEGSSVVNNKGTLTNSGNIYNDASITNSGTFDITSTGHLQNSRSGTFTQSAGHTNVDGEVSGGTVVIQGGSIGGSGSISADSITIGASATVKPGNSPGTLIMTGDVDLFGALQTEIMSSSVYDVLEVQGTVTLADTSSFAFLFDSSYIAIDGDSFDFLMADTFDFGSFDLLDMSHFSVVGLVASFDWSISFIDNANNPDFSYLSLNLFKNGSGSNPVSAPTTLALFGLTLSLMGWRRRYPTKALA